MNSMKAKMVAGEVVLGTMLSEVPCANLVRLFGTAGFEFVIVDCEHGCFDFSQLANIIAVANGFGMPLLVRIPAIARDFITKVLDMGADGLLAPMTNTSKDAERLVEFAKYLPIGRRGMSTTRAHSNYAPPPMAEYVEMANRRTMLLVQIETMEAVDNAAAIASVAGVDALIIGPNDLAADLGKPGDFSSSDFEKAVMQTIAAAKEAGTPSGIVDSKIPFLHRWRERGMTVFCCGSELGMLLKAARETVREFYGTYTSRSLGL